MVANVTAVTAATAWTQAPAVTNVKAALPANDLPAGKDQSAVGKDLPPAREVAAAEVEQALVQLNELMQQSQRSLRFQVDKLSGRTIITVLDDVTKEIVRQIPPPELMALVRKLEQAGSLLDVVG
jgi:flagellar protein FlaG